MSAQGAAASRHHTGVKFLQVAAFAAGVPLALLAVAPAATIRVPAGGDLQQAIDRARPGETLLLAPGATYVGNFTLPEFEGREFITIRTDGEGLPAPGERIAPSHAPRLARLRSPNRQPVLATARGAHHWRLELLEFLPTREGFGDIITLGNGGPAQSTRDRIPHDLVIDRCYIHGDAVQGQKRGIALNSASTAITNSYISDIKARGQDTQAIGGWNGPGAYRIENNYLEAAGENFILGGADPPIQGLVTEDVVFRRNHLAKPIAWRTEGWQVKNLFELKNARRVLVEDNLMEYVWKQAQVGFAILLTPRNQDGQAPWVTIQDVTIRRNIIRHAGSGIQIVGEDSNYPSGSTERVVVADNVFDDIDGKRWGGAGTFLLTGEGASDLTIERNTVDQSGNIVMVYGGTKEKAREVRGFVFRDNLVRHNAYGVHGADRAPGKDTLNWYFPGGVFTGNTIEGGDSGRYPAGNTFVTPAEFARLLSQRRDSAADRGRGP